MSFILKPPTEIKPDIESYIMLKENMDLINEGSSFFEMPIKKIIIDTSDNISNATVLSDCNNDSTSLEKNESKTSSKHNMLEFHFTCNCEECLDYRLSILNVYSEDRRYNLLWQRLQLMVYQYYDLLPENSKVMEKHYKLLMSASNTKWISDGRMDLTKYMLTFLGTNIPLTSDKAFLIVFTTLHSRDHHQLFELLCIQLRSLMLAYNEGIKELIKQDSDGGLSYDPKEIILFLLNGYDSVCASAKSLPALLNGSANIEQFSLTWLILNQRMYQRCVFNEVQKYILDSLFKLKEIVESGDYEILIYRFLKFDDEMTSIAEKWKEIWFKLHAYHMSEWDIERRKRISSIHELLYTLKNVKTNILDDFDAEKIKHTLRPESSDINDVWKCTLYDIKNLWVHCTDYRLIANLINTACLKCKSTIDHYVDCKCRTCIIAGGPSYTKIRDNCMQLFCSKCSFFEKLDPDYLDIAAKLFNNRILGNCENEDILIPPICFAKTPAELKLESIEFKNNIVYHISWAVFKHFPDRLQYLSCFVDPKPFCIFQDPPCNRIGCRVANHIIAGIFPIHFTKLVIKSYIPITNAERKIYKKNGIIKFQESYDCDKTNLDKLHLLHSLDEIYKVDANKKEQVHLTNKEISMFAEYYLTDFIFPNHEILYPYFLKLFKVNYKIKDIELELQWLEYIIYMKMSNNLVEQNNKIDSTIFNLFNSHKQMVINKGAVKKENIQHTCSLDAISDSSSSNSMVLSCSSNCCSIHSEDGFQNVQCISEILSSTGSANHKCIEESTEPNKELQKSLEARLKNLKREHNVLKSMVKDLEQIKENEDKLTQTPESPHQCCADHNDILEDCHSSKMCHRGDGQCTCYYCTIFGHIECTHGRSNETRERLRKRLHQLHTKDKLTKEQCHKNVKATGLFKKINLSKVVNNLTKMENFNNKNLGNMNIPDVLPMKPPVTVTNTVIEQKKNNISNILKTEDKLKDTGKEKAKEVIKETEKIKLNEKGKESDKIKGKDKELEKEKGKLKETLQERERKKLQQLHDQFQIADNNLFLFPSTSESVFSSRRDSSSTINGSNSVEALLEFIEGKKINSLKDPIKKAAKKAKQKQKKVDQKLVEELELLKLEFELIHEQELNVKNDLKLLKSVRRKDKKKINETEINLKKLDRNKSKIEKIIFESINTIREGDPDFKFSYQVTAKAKPVSKVQKPEPAALNQSIPSLETYNISSTTTTLTPINQTQLLNGTKNTDKQNCEISLDPAKRMVTIRRVNLPHAEPQVTVTAKGASPDKDQLLYTFINGQLVPANFLLKGGSVHHIDDRSCINKSNNKPQQKISNEKLNKKNLKTVNTKNKDILKNKEKLITPRDYITGMLEQLTLNNKTVSNEQINKKVNKKIPFDNKLLNTNINNNGNVSVNNNKVQIENKIEKTAILSCSSQKLSKKQQKNDNLRNIKFEEKQSCIVNEISISTKKEKSKNDQVSFKNVEIVKKMKNEGKKKTVNNSSNNKKLDEEKKIHVENVVKKVIEIPISIPILERKISVPKYEYIDEQFSKNKFGVLDIDDDSFDIEPDIVINNMDEIVVKSENNKTNKNNKKHQNKITSKSTNNNNNNNNNNKIENAKKQNQQKNKTKKIDDQLLNAQFSNMNIGKDENEKCSKRQKNKQQNQQEYSFYNKNLETKKNSNKNNLPPDNTLLKAERMAKTLTNSMHRMHLNADTTIELVKDSKEQYDQNAGATNISIMDQLNRGVKVEGLTLPPGITLTRVDPSRAEVIQAKKESIVKLCQPMTPVETPKPPQQMLESMQTHNIMGYSQDSGGVIMVDTLKLNKNVSKLQLLNTDSKPPNKKNRGKNKNNKTEDEQFLSRNSRVKNKKDVKKTECTPKMVTLRNPMFHPVGDVFRPNSVPPQNKRSVPVTNPTITSDQPAAIIKNENGMFTIRNPALHQALSNGVSNTFRQYSSPSYVNNSDPPQENFSYFSDGIIQNKYNSAIGSEMKNAQILKQYQQCAWTDHSDAPNQEKTTANPMTYSQNSFGYNSDFIRAAPISQVQPNQQQQEQQNFYNRPYSVFPQNDNNNCNNNSLFVNNGGGHMCDDNHYVPAADDNNRYSSNSNIMPAAASPHKYDDYKFLQNLQPGQRLNSEVTIHNINESKFLRGHNSNISNGVEITKIHGPPTCDHANLAVGSNRTTASNKYSIHNINLGSGIENVGGTGGVGEYGDSIFVPNQSVNLSELESEERDIESFKRFNYYFEPPKNKLKVDINVNEIVVNKKKCCDDESPILNINNNINNNCKDNINNDIIIDNIDKNNININNNNDDDNNLCIYININNNNNNNSSNRETTSSYNIYDTDDIHQYNNNNVVLNYNKTDEMFNVNNNYIIPIIKESNSIHNYE